MHSVSKVVPCLTAMVNGRPMDMVTGLPTWAVFRLGKQVRLARDFSEYEGESPCHQAGSLGLLDAIQHRQSGPTAMVDFGTWEGAVEVPFDMLEPVDWLGQ